MHRNEGSDDSITCNKDEKGVTKTIPSSSQAVSGTVNCPDVEQICVKYNQDTY